MYADQAPHLSPHTSQRPLRVAVIGSGIAGLAVAHTLRGLADVTLFESGSYFGGHTHTVDVTLPTAQGPVTHGVDTGFLVLNERTYPHLLALLAQLDVAIAPSDMSFSVQVPGAGPGRGADARLEWSGTHLGTVFAQRRNLFNGRFWRMLADLLRFNRLATRLAKGLDLPGEEAALMQPLGEFLTQHRFSAEFRDWYFLPMLGCIWSCPTDQMLHFPVATMVRFCHNHGLIQVANRPQWYTVRGGARHYVDKIVATVADARLNTPVQSVVRDAQGVTVVSAGRAERFDKVVMACHSDQALALLAAPTLAETEVLGALRYQPNRAVLHTDVSVLPQRRTAWAAWNYERAASTNVDQAQVCLHYWLNALQPLPFEQPVVVSLNPLRPIDPAQVLGEYDYAHPVFDLAAIRAQRQVPQLQGQQHTYFCGAWTGYGFHEDGLKSGLAVAQALLQLPTSVSPHALSMSRPRSRSTLGLPPTRRWPLVCRSDMVDPGPAMNMPPTMSPGSVAHVFSAMATGPLIGFGQVRHTRLRPTRHAFAYGNYFLMLPMRSLREHGSGPLARNRRAALSFWDADHGDGRADALAWLDELLQREGVHTATGEVWLHTYPRVWGHTFKPVSFWHCHGADGELVAIVAEVNNTFGERHCYLLDQPRYGHPNRARKVFHVSPFCAVQGDYRFVFMRTTSPERLVARVDLSDEHGPLLQTSVSGELLALTPATQRRALWAHPAMTLGVVARIHWQALQLWRKKVRWLSKPEPPTQFLTR